MLSRPSPARPGCNDAEGRENCHLSLGHETLSGPGASWQLGYHDSRQPGKITLEGKESQRVQEHGMVATVHLFGSPAGSGKTTQLLARCREASARGPASVLWL